MAMPDEKEELCGGKEQEPSEEFHRFDESAKKLMQVKKEEIDTKERNATGARTSKRICMDTLSYMLQLREDSDRTRESAALLPKRSVTNPVLLSVIDQPIFAVYSFGT